MDTLEKFEKVHEKSTVREQFAKNMEIHVLSGSERCERVIEHRREKNVILNEKTAGAIRIIKNEQLFSANVTQPR